MSQSSEAPGILEKYTRGREKMSPPVKRKNALRHRVCLAFPGLHLCPVPLTLYFSAMPPG